MSPEADKILGVFRDRGLRSGAQIHPADFGNVIVWEAGFVRDEPVRQALAELFENGYLVEYEDAFELTGAGEQYIYTNDVPMTQLIDEDGPRTWMVPCPGCGSALEIEDGSAEVIHEDCPGCGRRLIRVWTDTAFMITFSEWASRSSVQDE